MTDETRSTPGMGRYVPGWRRSGIWTRPGRAWQAVDASLCFVDISGFTKLSERLARRGRIGAEELTEVLNRVFGEHARPRLPPRRRPAQVRRRRAPAAVRGPGPRRPGRQRRGRDAGRAAGGRGRSRRRSVGCALRMSVGVHSGDVHLFRVGRSPPRAARSPGPAATPTTADGARRRRRARSSSARRHGRLLPPGAARRRRGPGWRLRWRQPKVEPLASRARRARCPKQVVADASRWRCATTCAERSTEPEHRAATVAFVRFQGRRRAHGRPEAPTPWPPRSTS